MSSSRVIVIAYGNPLRGDDGLAWHAAEQLKKSRASSHIQILERHQLAPEVAEAISQSAAVIFLDAAAVVQGKTLAGEIRILEIVEHDLRNPPTFPFHHQYSPLSILALAAELYRATPRAFVVTLTGEDFSPGERLSPLVESAVAELVARIEGLIGELIRSGQ